MLHRPSARCRAALARPGTGTLAVLSAVVVALPALPALAACSSAGADSDRSASAVVSSLGAVPVPTPRSSDPVPTASSGHAQVLAMGEPVEVVLPDGTDAVLTARGPDQAKSVPTGRGDNSTPATVTLLVDVRRGTLHAAATDLTSRDELGQPVALTPVGAAEVDAGAGHPGRLVVGATFSSGSAQVTYQHAGVPLAVWDFTIELD